MNTKRYKITLSDEERDIANKIVSENLEDSKVILRAQILLLSDSSNTPELSIMQIAEAAKTSNQTVTKIRTIYHEQGFHIALRVLDRKGYECCITNNPDFLQHINEIISEQPAKGRSKWSLRMICSECVSRGYVDVIAPATIMEILKRNNITL